MPCRRRGRTPGSGETGRPRTRGGLRTPFGESGLPAPAPGAPGGPSSGSLANPSVHLRMDHGTRCADGSWPRWIRTTIPRSKVWCPAVGRGASRAGWPQLREARDSLEGSEPFGNRPLPPIEPRHRPAYCTRGSMLPAFLLFCTVLPSRVTPPVAPPRDLPVHVWLNFHILRRAGPARVFLRASDDGYVVVLRADAAGKVSVLFPLDPGDDNFVRGGQTIEVRSRGDLAAFFVDEIVV